MSLEEYYNRHFKENPIELKDEGMVQDDEETLQAAQKLKDDVHKWKAKCEFQCAICQNFKTNFKSSLTYHINSIHKFLYQPVTKRDRELAEKKRQQAAIKQRQQALQGAGGQTGGKKHWTSVVGIV